MLTRVVPLAREADKPVARVRLQNHWALQGKTHRAEGWDRADTTHLYVEQSRPNHSLSVAHCSRVNVTVPEKLNHASILSSEHCVIRVRAGLISGLEVTHCENTRIVVRGRVPTLQVDLSSDVAIEFCSVDDALACVIVHSSNARLSVRIAGGPAVDLHTSLLGDQQGTYLAADGAWHSRATEEVKGQRGYLDLDHLRSMA